MRAPESKRIPIERLPNSPLKVIVRGTRIAITASADKIVNSWPGSVSAASVSTRGESSTLKTSINSWTTLSSIAYGDWWSLDHLPAQWTHSPWEHRYERRAAQRSSADGPWGPSDEGLPGAASINLLVWLGGRSSGKADLTYGFAVGIESHSLNSFDGPMTSSCNRARIQTLYPNFLGDVKTQEHEYDLLTHQWNTWYSSPDMGCMRGRTCDSAAAQHLHQRNAREHLRQRKTVLYFGPPLADCSYHLHGLLCGKMRLVAFAWL